MSPTMITCPCGVEFERTYASGAAPKYCPTCRPAAYKGGRQRGQRYSGEPGPIMLVRELLRDATPEMRMRVCMAALCVTIGIPEDMAESIVSAVDELVELGETAEDVRRRLNHAGFGMRPAPSVTSTLGAMLLSEAGLEPGDV